MQKQVNRFIESHSLSCGALARYVDLVSETGELGKALLLATDDGKNAFQPTENAREEIGDCLFSLLALCSEMGIDAQDALDKAIDKYGTRLTQKGDAGSGRP